MLQVTGTKPLWEYINKRQVAVAEWVTLRKILEVYEKEAGYKGWGRLRDPLWR